MKRGVKLLATMACRPVLVLLLALFVQTAGAQLPLFQYAVFYNLNLEMDPGQPMVIAGPVFSNQGLWAGASTLTFSSTVQAVGTTNTSATDPFANAYPASGLSTNAGSGFSSFSIAGQPTSGNQPLIIPVGSSANFNNPANAEAVLNLPPTGLGAPNPQAYATSNQVYLFNECDLIISNAVYGTNGYATNAALGTSVDFHTNFTVWFQDPLNYPSLTLVTNDIVMLKNTTGSYTNKVIHIGGMNFTNYAATNILYEGYSFLTNVSFYDYRENKTVQAVQIDIAKFNRWLTNTTSSSVVSTNGTMNTDEGPTLENNFLVPDTGHGFRSIYVYNSVIFGSGQLPAVRLINGAQLPSVNPGLTVATPQPLYIYGNYNVQTNSTHSDVGTNITQYTYPAAVLADAITILSTNWSDSYSFVTNDPGSHNDNAAAPGDTTINAAVFGGIVQSDPAISGDYSGGVENFLRLLEDWGNNVANNGHNSTLTYNGSVAAVFPSIYATKHWQPTGNYYNTPTRHWAFDLNFETAAGLPPLTPMVGYQFPNILAQPQSQTVAVGGNVTFGVTVSSISTIFPVQWTLNGTNISGGTGGTNFITYPNGTNSNPTGPYGIALQFALTLTNVQLSQAGNYSLLITNSFGSTNTSIAVLTVDAPPEITMQPTNQSVLVNSNVTFNVTAAGSPPLSYQWIFNGTNYLADTNTSLTLTNVQVNQAGNYSVQVTNAFGITNSSSGVLTVDAPPTIMAQPTNETVFAGASANFNVTACGSAPLSYQWQFNTANIDGETNAALTLNTVNTNQSGIYAVVITNNFGSVTSSNAVLSVFATAVASFNAISVSDANGFQFTVGGVPGFNYAVEGSSNLIDWVSLITNTSPFNFADTNTPGIPQRFYRIRQVQ